MSSVVLRVVVLSIIADQGRVRPRLKPGMGIFLRSSICLAIYSKTVIEKVLEGQDLSHAQCLTWPITLVRSVFGSSPFPHSPFFHSTRSLPIRSPQHVACDLYSMLYVIAFENITITTSMRHGPLKSLTTITNGRRAPGALKIVRHNERREVRVRIIVQLHRERAPRLQIGFSRSGLSTWGSSF